MLSEGGENYYLMASVFSLSSEARPTSKNRGKGKELTQLRKWKNKVEEIIDDYLNSIGRE